MIRRQWMAAVLVAVLAGVFAGAAEERAVTIGEKVPDGATLRDRLGSRRALHSFTQHKAVVVAFLGTECPISNLYVPELLDLEKKYRSRQVQFLAVYSNESEDLDQVAMHAYDRDVPFPVLKDCGQTLADLAGVKRVPAVAVLDGDFVLRYRGRIDDRYGAGHRRDKATRDDLREALEEILAGKPVSVAQTEADGCLLDRDRKPTPGEGVTYSKQVARIIQQKCQSCHRPEQAAPFALRTYDDAARRGRMIKEVTQQRRMPPWHADPRHGSFSNDRRLTSAEIDTLAAWVDAGMPRGEERDLPKPIDWPKGWLHGTPDLVLSMPEEFEVPATGSLPYKHWIIDTNFTEDRWVTVAEARPGAPGVVHHIVAYILREGQRSQAGADGSMSILVGWAPGDLGLVCPPDTALRIPKGAKLRFELHYTPNGTAQKDRSSVGITFAKQPPKHELFMNPFANESIVLPPHEPHYRAEANLRLPADARLISFVPHMHWRGKDYRYEVIHADGRRETLLSVPRWDFNWQSVYQLKEPVKLPKGARLYSVAHWDNSSNNPYNPAPEKTVRFGLQTWDEMMVGWVAYIWERPETAAELAKDPPSPSDQFFDRMDRNADGAVTKDEFPEQMRTFLFINGVKLPEKMDRKEFAVFFEEMRKKLPQRPRPGASNETEKKAEDKKPDEKK